MDNWTITEPQTLQIDGVRELRTVIVRGRVDVITHDGPGTTVEVSEVSAAPLNVSLVDGTLKIEHLDSGNWLMKIVNINSSARAVVSIAIPVGIPVTTATVSGDGMVSGTGPRTDLKTVSGSLLADATTGILTTETVSGEIIVRQHTGPLVAKSISGEITASGELSSIRANTVSGNLSFDVLGAPEDFASKSVSGDITIRLPYGVGVDLGAKSTSGSILLDDDRYAGVAQNIRTSSGPGSPRVTVRTSSVSGNVAIVHSAEDDGGVGAGGPLDLEKDH
ncbi:DUF4097 family beta strand repeat-containing protein [Arthrobacter sp. 35W]|uniref:DUF4097 family beta strand repeat-containing protein n=1 Tax=Arthrobacter sp. 35W TaxID=1132441 RepID=UPI0004239F90|nr:DUF4097 family beta strand repeat-containing protein [Arthrobacter sp. 35W]